MAHVLRDPTCARTFATVGVGFMNLTDAKVAAAMTEGPPRRMTGLILAGVQPRD